MGKNGAYIIEDGKISLVTETKKIKNRQPVPAKLLEAIKEALEKGK